MNDYKLLYLNKVVNNLKKQFDYKSVMQVPKLIKITVNIGLGEAVKDKKLLDSAVSDLATITGQKPIVTYAKKSIAGFKVREGWPIGCKVTLRKSNMYNFLQKLICIAIPRIRDFRGFSVKSFDGRGNFSFGIAEQLIFPEINYDKIDLVRGMDITITTSAKNDAEAEALLLSFNFPFQKRKIA